MHSFDSALRFGVAALAAVMTGLCLHAFATKPIALWTVVSLSAFLVMLAISLVFALKQRGEFFAIIAALFAAIVIGRLFSTMHFETPGGTALSELDPLMIAETGPGIDSIMWTSTALVIALSFLLLRFAWRQSHGDLNQGGADTHWADAAMGQPTVNDWGLTFIRIYVGLMFVAHFAGHLFAGPAPFKIFVDYFGSIGLPAPAAFVILAGLIEVAVTIGLAFGLMTRLAAVGAAIYLFVAVWLGDHFSVGYIWVLPTGGWEFPALWIFAISVFAITGGGPTSLDHVIRQRYPTANGALRAVTA